MHVDVPYSKCYTVYRLFTIYDTLYRSYTVLDLHQSAIKLNTLTGKVNYFDYAVTVALVKE